MWIPQNISFLSCVCGIFSSHLIYPSPPNIQPKGMDHITGMYFLCNTTREIRSSAVKWENKILERGLDFSAIVIYLAIVMLRGRNHPGLKWPAKKENRKEKDLYLEEKHEGEHQSCSQVNNLPVWVLKKATTYHFVLYFNFPLGLIAESLIFLLKLLYVMLNWDCPVDW